MRKRIAIKNYKTVSIVMAAIIASSGLMSARAQASDDTNGKEEVVYVNTDASGKITGTYVVNIFTDKEIKDYGNYSQVKNMNTEDAIDYKDGEVTIQSSASKLYYEGTLENAEMPWNVNIIYRMDGTEYSPEEIAGKSGKLSIEISITQNEKAKEGFFDNYALQTVVQLDTTLCQNILSDDATTANVGNLKQLTYTVMAGNEKDIVITSDVTEFEMESIAINGVRLNLGIDEDSIDKSELTNKIVDLQDTVKELNEGADDLNGGAGDLKEGAQTLYEGIATIDDALATLNEKSADLTSGSSEVKEALKTIQSALEDVNLSTKDLENLGTASSQMSGGIDSLTSGIQTLDASIGSYYEALASAGLSDVSVFVETHNQAIAALGISDTQRAIYSAYVSGGDSEVQSKIGELVAGGDGEATALYTKFVGGDASVITEYVTTAGKLISVESLLQADISYIQGSQQLISGIDGTLDSNSGALMTGALTLQSSYKTFDEGIQELVSSLSTLATNMSDLKDGIDLLVENYDTLDNGVDEYTDAVESIYEGYAQVSEGALKIVNGTSTLYNGTTELTDGTGEFVDETDGLQDEVDNKIDDMLEEYTGSDYESVSFVSDKNTNVNSVQFVIKTEAIQVEEAQYVEDTTTEKLNLWDKFMNLFGL